MHINVYCLNIPKCYQLGHNMKQILIIAILISTVAFSKAQSLKDIFISKDFSKLKTYIANKGGNTPEQGYYPIVVASKLGDLETVQELVRKGADIDVRGHKKMTALMYAAKYNHIDIGLLLVKKKANLILKDKSGYTAYDIAMKAGHSDFANRVIRNHLDSYADTDGPFIFEEGGAYKAHYILPKSGVMQAFSEDISTADISKHSFHCHDKNGSTLFEFNVNPREQIYPSIYDDNEAIFALSDIEGNLPALINLLKAGKVMNSNFGWTFGKGHLVLVGDFFDRGDQVTECLWLIYKLEQEARKQGGMVHFIIGNHELMNLRGDIRFARTKYKTNAKMIGKSCHDLYAENSILGRWLRTKPSMLKIRDVLFLHAGLSPTFLSYQLDIETVNQTTMVSIDVPKDRYDNMAAKVLGKEGPLWYRGIARNDISSSDLDGILGFYQVNTIIFGHTKVKRIETTHGGKIINLDVHHEDGAKYQQALLIDSGAFYNMDVTGKKSKVK